MLDILENYNQKLKIKMISYIKHRQMWDNWKIRNLDCIIKTGITKMIRDDKFKAKIWNTESVNKEDNNN